MSRPHHPGSPLYGVVAEFRSADAVVKAAKELAGAGYEIEVCSPRHIPGLSSLRKSRRWLLPLLGVAGAGGGATTGFLMQWYASVIAYPVNVGGRPYNSWPAFLPISLELAILGAAVGIVAGFFLLARLPRLHHPLFGRDGFTRASRDRFFVAATTEGEHFDPDAVRRILERHHPESLSEVAR
jgi:hypothetical protein